MICCPLPGKTKIKETTETRMTFQNFTIDTDADGIALVTWNMPNRSMNVIDEKVIEELAAIAERVATDAAIKGAVLTSGKDSFCGGADLTMLEGLSRTFAELTKSQGEEAANKRRRRCCLRKAASCRCSIVASKPAASRGCVRSTVPPWAAASNSRSLVITALRQTIPGRGLGCPKSR